MKTNLMSWERKKKRQEKRQERKATKNPFHLQCSVSYLFLLSQHQYNQLACAFLSASPALEDQQVKSAEGSNNYFYETNCYKNFKCRLERILASALSSLGTKVTLEHASHDFGQLNLQG